MNLERLLLVLRARHWMVSLSVLVCGGAALGLSLWSTKQYTAQTQLLMDVREPDLLLNQGASYSVLAPTYMATQVDIIRSDRVATKVVRALGLDKNEAAIAQWKTNRQGDASLEQYFSEVLNRFLAVNPSRTSNILTLDFTNPSAEFAAAAVNAYAKAYLNASVDLKVDPTRDYAEWFAERSRQERARLEEAQDKLSQFQRENGIVAADERVDVENARFNELSTQLTSVQAQLAESQSREREAQKMGTSPDVQHNTVVESLRADIARKEALLQDLDKQYGHRHPAYQRASAELEALKTALDAEMRKVAGTVGASNDVNVQREAQLREALQAQKQRLLKLRALRDQLAVLQRDVDSAQRAFDLVGQRLSQTNIESQVQHTNIVILAEAKVPNRPSSPHVKRNTAIGVAAGLLLGLAMAIGFELRRPRLRSEADVGDFLGLPVLASLPGPRRFARFGRGRQAEVTA